jgi:hypothetical protein
MTTTPKDVLVAARKLIEDPAHWTQGSYARDAAGNKVSENSPKATCWCTMGALYKVSGCHGVFTGAGGRAIEVLARAAWDEYHRGVVVLNDQFGHKAVMQVFDKAIVAAEGVA